jgi:hypothetical protein
MIDFTARSEGGCFGVVVEGANEAPILMEAEGKTTSYEAAEARLKRLIGGQYFRGCVVKLVPVYGNEAVLTAMQGEQK